MCSDALLVSDRTAWCREAAVLGNWLKDRTLFDSRLRGVSQKVFNPSVSLPARARHLPGGGIEAIEEIGCGDHEDQGCESLLIIVPGSLVPDLIGDWIGPVGKPGDGLGERECGTFGVGEVGCFTPSRYCEEALVCFACLFGAACTRVNAEATAIDLARSKVDKLKRCCRYAAFSRGLEQRLYAIHGVRKDCCRVAHSCLHDTFSFRCRNFTGMLSHPGKDISNFLPIGLLRYTHTCFGGHRACFEGEEKARTESLPGSLAVALRQGTSSPASLSYEWMSEV